MSYAFTHLKYQKHTPFCSLIEGTDGYAYLAVNERSSRLALASISTILAHCIAT
jgi:hypothetical protein